MEKINDAGFIPPLDEINFRGRKVYFKRATLMMGIFRGVGISQILLEKFNKNPEILICFDGKRLNDRKFNGLYLATMQQFRDSPKKFANGYNDVQRFVSFSDMKKVLEETGVA